MRKALLAILPLIMAASCSAFPETSYAPPSVVSAGDSYVPYQVVKDGLFVLDLALSDAGTIERIDRLRNPGAMIGAAETSVRSWKFEPAFQDGKPTNSRLTAVFVYRPPNYGAAGAVSPEHFVPVIPPDQEKADQRTKYVPVGIMSFDYPEYPVNSVASGSVVVQVTVSDSGDIAEVEFLHTMAGFDGLVREALKKWQFRPASLAGGPIPAKIVIAFVFQAPPSTIF